MHVDAFLHRLTILSDYKQQIAHVQYIPPRDAIFGKLDKPLHHLLQSRLKSLGLSPLYVHQSQAINTAHSGKNVMVATSSASGKTLCYNVPVLESILTDRTSRALYLFPTNARLNLLVLVSSSSSASNTL